MTVKETVLTAYWRRVDFYLKHIGQPCATIDEILRTKNDDPALDYPLITATIINKNRRIAKESEE